MSTVFDLSNLELDVDFKIQQGKFGRVEKWNDTKTEHSYLLKKIVKAAKNSIAMEQLKNEAQFTFETKGLPEIVSFTENQHEITLIRRFKQGIPLTEYWKQKQKNGNKIQFTQVITEAFQSVYSELENQKIVHCDLKPSNILVHETSRGIEIEIIDFGLAIDRKKEISIRKTLFQLRYSAPELILNHLQIIDHRTDIYSYGLILYNLWTNTDPFFHANPSVATNLQITYPLPKHSKLPKEVFVTLQKATAKHRFSLPPNKLTQIQVMNYLELGMTARFDTFDLFSEEVQRWKAKKKSWFRSLMPF